MSGDTPKTTDKKETKSSPKKKITITFQESYNTKLDQIELCYSQANGGSQKIAGSFNMGVDEWELFKRAMLTIKDPDVTIVCKKFQTETPVKEEKIEL